LFDLGFAASRRLHGQREVFGMRCTLRRRDQIRCLNDVSEAISEVMVEEADDEPITE
jgi:hypothetical protein